MKEKVGQREKGRGRRRGRERKTETEKRGERKTEIRVHTPREKKRKGQDGHERSEVTGSEWAWLVP